MADSVNNESNRVATSDAGVLQSKGKRSDTIASSLHDILFGLPPFSLALAW